MMLVVGLTGGIATGKSTVARMFAGLGAKIVDCDELVRTVVQPHMPAWQEIVNWLGPCVFYSDGTIDRSALGDIAFSDPTKRKRLEQIIHPRVLEEQKRILEELRSHDPSCIAMVDVPLLFEVNLEDSFETIILVYAPPEIQIERLIKRNHFTREGAEKRLQAQMPIDEKLVRSHFIIHNDGSLENTMLQVNSVYLSLLGRARN